MLFENYCFSVKGNVDMLERTAHQIVKGYELTERIGSGGFGAVYRAYQSTVGREVAVKIILPGFANHPDFIRRFETEAQLVARLEHLHIVPLYDYWRDPSGAFLVMRWLRGGNLREALGDHPFDLASTVDLFSQIASALAAAHRKDIVHRDVKPSNILLDEEDNAYLADFSIARDVGQPISSLDEPERILGSPGYLSPEQIRGELVSPQTDIYSMGVLLFELLSGSHPFPGLTPVELLYRHLNDPLPTITTLPMDIQAGINAVIQKATEKNPRRRYPDVLEMAEALCQAAHLEAREAEITSAELLTLREVEILGLIVAGHSNKQIAQELFVELTTIKWYITQIYRKLNVRTRYQAILRARQLQLVFPGQERETGKASSSVSPESLTGTIELAGLGLINPYKGLRPFETADSRDFYGREELVEKLVKRLAEKSPYARFLAVVGPSGCGKSSLVKAGLIPALRRGALDRSDRWFIIEMEPGSRPVDELEVALTRVAGDSTVNIRAQLDRDGSGLLRAASLILPPDDSQLLICIDQFEELFSLVQEEAPRSHFLNLITAAVTDPNSRVRVLATLRADFYDRPLNYPEFGELVRRRLETVLPLNAQEMERAILLPAQQVGVKFEPGLAAGIIEEIHYQPGALPLLQYALTELFDRREDHRLTHQAYQAIGGVVGALANRAEATYNQLDSGSQTAARQLFLQLVALGDTGDGRAAMLNTRQRALRTELLASADDPEEVEELIDTYAAFRLLTLDHDPETRQPTVTLAHEALIREWERLQTWIEDNREDLLQHQRLGGLTRDWQEAGQDPAYLLRQTRLDQFSAWAAQTGLRLSPGEKAFLEASLAARQQRLAEAEAQRQHELDMALQLAGTERQRAEEQSRSNRRLRRRAIFLSLALLAAIGLAIAAFLFFRQAEAQRRLASTRELAAAAIGNLEFDPQLSLLLALQAAEFTYRDNQTILPEVENALRRSLQSSRVVRILPHGGSLAVSPDGLTIATGGQDGLIKIWQVQDDKQLLSWQAHSAKLFDLAFSPDGKRLASAGQDGLVRLWETGSGNPLHTWQLPQGGAYSVAFSPDGGRVAAGGEGTAWVWDASTFEKIRSFPGHDSAIAGIAFTPDGKGLSTLDANGSPRLWEIETGKQKFLEGTHLIPDLLYLAGTGFSPSGSKWVYSAGFNLAKIKLVKNLLSISGVVASSDRFLIGHSAPVTDADFSPDGTMIATSSLDGTTRLWDATTQEHLLTLSRHDLRVNHLAFLPDQKHLATSGEDNTTRIWDISPNGGREVTTFVSQQGTWAWGLQSITYSSDSQSLMSFAHLTETIYDANTGRELAENPRSEFTVLTLINPSGNLIASYDPRGITRIIERSSGKERFRLPGNSSTQQLIASNPAGTRLALANQEGEVLILEMPTSRQLLSFQAHPGRILSINFSPDGTRLATGGADGSARVWDPETGKELQEITGQIGGIAAIAFDFPAGDRLATGGYDNTVKLWDVRTGEELITFTGLKGTTSSLAFSPDGRRLAASSLDGAVHVYTLDLQELLEIARKRAVRSLTNEECQQYLHQESCPAVPAELVR
jgi:WD40 repeat protein/serine/threonine protein kinase